ncbi:hypothetical protein EON79_18005, partial [bacterium]
MRKILVLLAAAVAASASAEVRLIVQLAPGADPRTVASVHRLGYLDRTDDGPFALLRAKDEADAHRAQEEMLTDPQVVWAEDDDEIVAPEGKGQRPAPTKKGSIMPVVGDRFAI